MKSLLNARQWTICAAKTAMVEQMLEKEMEEHLGHEKLSIQGRNSDNSRNTKSTKNVQSSYGNLEIDVPRDRIGDFEPQLVKKRQRNISSFDEKVISMYAKGMSARDIQAHVQEIYQNAPKNLFL